MLSCIFSKWFRLLLPAFVGMVSSCAGSSGGERRVELQQVNIDSIFSEALATLPDSLTADDIYLSCGLLRPEESMQALRRRVRDGRISTPEFTPLAINAMWGAAAWEIYCATGSAEWLREAYDVLTASIADESRLSLSPQKHLTYGIPEYAAEMEGYYPRTMTEMERFQTLSTTVNAERSYSCRIASMMAAELKLDTREAYSRSSADIRNAINDYLWIPESQRYAAYLYGIYFPIQNNASDAIANSLCILFDVATPEMSRAIIEQMPVTKSGVPTIYPSSFGDSSPLAPTLYALAAAKVRNTQAFALGASMLHTFDSDHESSAGMAALVTRGFFGLRLQPDGIHFSPMVPSGFKGVKHIRSLKYRDALLDISLHGTGDRIASFAIDSVSGISPMIPASISGHHKIDIVLTGNNIAEKKLNISPENILPGAPEIDWLTDRTARITDFNPDARYIVHVNGVTTEEISTENFNINTGNDEPTFCEISLIDSQGFQSVAPRPHIYAPAGTMVTIPASSLSPRRAPMHLIKDYSVATNYIELAARHNTRITCYANIEREGDYFITIGYSNGSNICALRSLDINDEAAGTIISPSVRPDDWITTGSSNTLTIPLKRGVNKIALTYIRGTMLLNKITLIKKP